MNDWPTILLTVVYAAAALLALIRIVHGPGVLDRIVASDVLLVTLMCALGTEMAVNGHTHNLPILLVLAMFGVVGSFTVSRFLVTASDPSRDDEAAPAHPSADTATQARRGGDHER